MRSELVQPFAISEKKRSHSLLQRPPPPRNERLNSIGHGIHFTERTNNIQPTTQARSQKPGWSFVQSYVQSYSHIAQSYRTVVHTVVQYIRSVLRRTLVHTYTVRTYYHMIDDHLVSVCCIILVSSYSTVPTRQPTTTMVAFFLNQCNQGHTHMHGSMVLTY